MYLEKLEIQGFKSFAHKVSLEFSRGIAAVVGPNGSGKSNIADSIRWVLGEQSLKLLRGKKSEDVIFAGSDKKTRLGMAEVSLTLDNTDHQAPIDYDRVVVSRRIYSDGTSEYLINNSMSRLTDIQLLLARSNIGQRTYSVIGQGMVDNVLIATPTERKQFFDEAAGVRPFQIKKEQAEHKLAATRENVAQAQLLIDEIGPRLRSLTRQVKRLNEREQIQAELREVQVKAYTIKLVSLRKELNSVRDRSDSAEADQQKAAEQVQRIQQKVDAEERGASRDETFTKLQREHQRLVDQRNHLLTDRAAIAGKVAATLAQAGQSNVVWLQQRKAELEKSAIASEEDIKTLSEKIKKTDSQNEDGGKKMQALAEELKNIEAELLRAEQALKTRATMTVPDLAKEVTEIMSAHQKFLAAVQAATSVDELEALRREAKRLDHRASEFITKLGDQAPTIDPAQLIALQRSLHELMQKKEKMTATQHDLQAEHRILVERQIGLTRESDRISEELKRVVKELQFAGLKPKNKGEADAAIVSAQADVDTQVATLEKELAQARTALDGFNQTEQSKRDKLFALQKEVRQAQDIARESESRLADARVDIARLETREEDVLRELRAELPAEFVERVEKAKSIATGALEELEQEITKGKHSLELIGGIDENSMQEYNDTKTRYEFLTGQVDDLTRAGVDLETAIEKLDKTIKERFEKSFEKVSAEFSKYFKILFSGGHASITLVKEEILPPEEEKDEDDEDDDEEEEEEILKPKVKGEKVVTGVEIFATPPGKRLRGISMLSGGERALTSIALICAILAANPSPFVVLDEVDAALDESNSIRFAQILEKLSHRTQFITISHNRATMQHASLMYGVTMGDDGASRLLSVKMADVDKVMQKGE